MRIIAVNHFHIGILKRMYIWEGVCHLNQVDLIDTVAVVRGDIILKENQGGHVTTIVPVKAVRQVDHQRMQVSVTVCISYDLLSAS